MIFFIKEIFQWRGQDSQANIQNLFYSNFGLFFVSAANKLSYFYCFVFVQLFSFGFYSKALHFLHSRSTDLDLAFLYMGLLIHSLHSVTFKHTIKSFGDINHYTKSSI